MVLFWGKRCSIGVRGVILGLEVLYWGKRYWGKRCYIRVRGVVRGAALG